MEETSVRVAIQGITASFHEVAAHTYFSKKAKTIECLSFYALCEALKNDEADYAVMAIENSIAGSILPNYFLLQQYYFSIVGELYLPIQMHLLGVPGATLKDVKVIESHPMAIRQCADFLYTLQGVEIKESDDTALSAKNVRDRNQPELAAIANEYAARAFGLDILEKRIETHKRNFTRFLVLTKRSNGKIDSNKASVSFEVADEVGSLADALTTFKHHQINLSRIQSVPIIGKPNEYTIHIDVEWQARENYELAMRDVLIQVRNLNVLGEYRKAKIEYH